MLEVNHSIWQSFRSYSALNAWLQTNPEDSLVLLFGNHTNSGIFLPFCRVYEHPADSGFVTCGAVSFSEIRAVFLSRGDNRLQIKGSKLYFKSRPGQSNLEREDHLYNPES